MAATTTLPFRKVWTTDTSGTLATATDRDSASETIYIPMTTSRSFRNVTAIVRVQDVTAAGDCTITAPKIGIKLGAAAFSTTTLGNPNAGSGENQGLEFPLDVTSYFNTNFGAGASQTCQIRFQATLAGTTARLNNISCEIIGTVDVDDASDNTQMKYVEFYCDTATGALTASLAEIGTNQFPQMDTLGEASVVIRQVWIEAKGNNGAVGTANNAGLGIQIDSNTEWVSADNSTAAASAIKFHYYYDVTSLSLATNAAHAIKIRSTNITTAATFNCPSIKVCVYYEFSWSASTSITNMAKIPFYLSDRVMSSTEGSVASSIAANIQEPGTITLMQSGVEVSFVNADATTLLLGVGAQSLRTYTPANVNYCGEVSISQRIDSGGAQGAAATFVRGLNTLAVFGQNGSAIVTMMGISGVVTLVYKSDKSSLGRKAHVRVLPTQLLTPTAANGGGPFTASSKIGFDFLDTDYSVVSAWFDTHYYMGGSAINAIMQLFVKSGSGELNGAYLYPQVTNGIRTESENIFLSFIAPIKSTQWLRWTGDPETTRMDPKAARNFVLYSNGTYYPALTSWICYHGHKKAVTRNVNRSNGGSVAFRLWNVTKGYLISSGTRSGDGSYTLPSFEDTDTYFVEAYEDDTHKARTGSVTPT